jgi:hypothetical protein
MHHRSQKAEYSNSIGVHLRKERDKSVQLFLSLQRIVIFIPKARAELFGVTAELK